MKRNPLRALLATIFIALVPALGGAGTAHAQAPKPMTFELEGNGGNCNGCSWIAAKGEITNETAAQFETFIRTKLDGGCFHVRMHSPGGSLVGGIRLGEMFRKHGCSVSVGDSVPVLDGGKVTPWFEDKPGFCYSSCAYALLGGKKRSVDDASRYGVHQHYIGGKRSDVMLREQAEADSMAIQVLSGLLVDYVMRMGADARLITLAALQSDRGNIPTMNRKLLEELRVVTDVAPPAAPWTLETADRESLVLRLMQPQEDDDTEMALTYCRRSQPDIFYLDISIPVDTDYLAGVQDWAQQVTEVTLNDSIKVKMIRTGKYKARGKEQVTLSLAVPRTTMARIANGTGLGWQVDTPRSVQSYFYGTLSTVQLKQFLPILQRNCLPN